MKKILFSMFVLVLLFTAVQQALAADKVVIYFFWGDGCPHCAVEKPFLEKMEQKYPELEVESFEVYDSQENQELFREVAEAYNTSARGVPTTFIGREFVVGFGSEQTTGKEIEELIQDCLEKTCPSPGEILDAGGIDNWQPPVEEPVEQSVEDPAQEPLGQGQETGAICIHFFVQDDCTQCENLAGFLKQKAEEYNVDFRVYNVSEDEESRLLYGKLQELYGVSLSGFPIAFVGDSYLMGDQSIRENIETVITRCQEQGCPCPVEEVKQTLRQMPKPSTFMPEEKEAISIPFFGGEIQVHSESSLFLLGAILGLADGVNPCMFSVLLFLLTYLLAIGSKKKAVRVGLVFALGVFVIYFLFMVGMINLIALIGMINKIKVVVAVLALIAGLIMIKDFFAYGKWFSLEIPKSTKPLVERLIKKGTVPSAILLALLSSLIELPCTAGIPLVYTTLLAQKGGAYIPYLAWYNLFFVAPLLVIIWGTAFAWAQVDKVEKWRQDFRKYMRLAAGMILIFLAVALLKGWM